MSAWPPMWRTRALESAGIPVSKTTLAIMRAWKDSTPLPPYTNNPLGMPAAISGQPRYMGTGYAMFGSMSGFYATFARFIKTYPGQGIVQAMTGDGPYAATWRAVSSLGWPGSVTETDYPAALLDLTSAAYREHVSATVPSKRKTSGMIGADPAVRSHILAQSRDLAATTKAISDTRTAVRYLIRRHARNG